MYSLEIIQSRFPDIKRTQVFPFAKCSSLFVLFIDQVRKFYHYQQRKNIVYDMWKTDVGQSTVEWRKWLSTVYNVCPT